MCFWGGRTRSINNYSTSQTVTSLQICCQEMHVTLFGMLKPCYTMEGQLVSDTEAVQRQYGEVPQDSMEMPVWRQYGEGMETPSV